MTAFLLGLLVLGFGVIAMRKFADVNPALLARGLKIGSGVAALGVAGLLSLRGMGLIAMIPAAIGSWLLTGMRLPSTLRNPWTQGPDPSRTSRIVTDTLEMVLDHDTGAMQGRVLTGVFSGRRIETMAPAEIAILWRDCQFADPKSAAVLEAYLDRLHPSWREDMSRAEAEPGAGGVMTEAEALDVLGLKPGAGTEDVRRAHRELIMKLHPDRGGSTYLTAKINEAKALLLKAGK